VAPLPCTEREKGKAGDGEEEQGKEALHAKRMKKITWGQNVEKLHRDRTQKNCMRIERRKIA